MKNAAILNTSARMISSCLLGGLLALITITGLGQTIDSKVIENGGPGDYKAIAAHDSSFSAYTIYRPKDMASAVAKEGKLPVVVFANGGCSNSSILDEKGLNNIASHGYVVIAIGPLLHEKPNDFSKLGSTNAYQLLKALDLITLENYKQGSPYYNRVNVNKVAAMGGSCGGLQAIMVSLDPRITTTILQNSGVFSDSMRINLPTTLKTMLGGEFFTKADLTELHAPIAYIIGNKGDIAYPNAIDDFSRLEHVPVAVASYGKVGHMGTGAEPYGGGFAVAELNWLDWQLKGQYWKSAFFLNQEYAKAMFPDWTISAKNFTK